MAGPWFTVMKSGDDWKFLENIWLTDGQESIQARVDYKVEFAEPAPASPTASTQH